MNVNRKECIINCILTLDYEIFGNGDGNPWALIIEPTYRLMNLLERYGAKLIIMADVSEILCFKHYYENTGTDRFFYQEITSQLKDAVKRGHDVQLHIHSSYFNSRFDGKHWEQCIAEYNMANLSFDRINEMVSTSVKYLNELLRPVKSDYNCLAFRAANWSMMPTPNIYKALVENGIKIDTSVYKGGCQGGNVCYDYRSAYSNIFSYHASSENINNNDPNGKITEYPIYTEMRPFWCFLSPMRVFRMLRAKLHKHKHSAQSVSKEITSNDNRKLSVQSFFRKSPWKFDFNQASGRQMIGALKRIMKLPLESDEVNVVLIGHSKSFVPYNEKTLETFLKFASKQENVQFSTFPTNNK